MVDLWHGEHHFEHLAAALLHDLGRIAVEGKGRGRGDERDAELFGDGLAPDSHRVGDDTVGRVSAHVGADHFVEGEGGLDQNVRRKGDVLADARAVGGREVLFAVIRVAGDELRARGFDERAHGFVGVVADLVTARGELAHDAERRVGVAVGRDAEKDDLAHLLSPPLSISEKMRSIYSRCMALGRMAMPRSSSPRTSSSSPG